MMRLNQAAAGLIAAILLISLTSCSDDTPKAGSEPTPTAPTSSATETPEPTATPTPVTDEDKAAAALLGYLKVRDNAYATGRISKKLNKYATGRINFTLQQFVTSLNKQAKAHFEGEWSHDVSNIKQKNSELVLVTDCEDASAVSILGEDDREMPWFSFQDEALPRRLEQTYEVVLDGGMWKAEVIKSLPNRVKKC